MTDHLPDADRHRTPHMRVAPPKRTAEQLESLLAERDRELAEVMAERDRLRERLKRHPEKD